MPGDPPASGVILTPHPRIAARLIGGRALILDPRTDALQRLNAVGSFIWDLIAQRRFGRDDLLDRVLAEFEVDPTTAAADLDALLAEMKARDLIAEQIAEAPPGT